MWILNRTSRETEDEKTNTYLHLYNPLLEMKRDVQLATLSSSRDKNWTHKVEKVNLHGAIVASNGDSTDSMVVNNLQRKEGTTRIIIAI